jgi:hypothetical protein
MEVKIQVFKEVCQTVVGGFQRDHTPRYEICGGDRTLISLLGTNGRCWERAQVGGKIQSRTSNVAGFQVSGRWLRSITNCCVLRRTCAILDFERSGCSRVTILTISMLDTLEDFQTFLDLFFPSETARIRKNIYTGEKMTYEASSSSSICKLLFTVHESPRVLHRVHGAPVVLVSHLTLILELVQTVLRRR